MTVRNLLKLGTLLVILTFVLSGVALAQVTVYVNNNGGVDSRTGANSNVADNINGPVATITRAVEIAAAGDIVSVAFTGVPYTEPGAPAGTALINKRVTLVGTGGTPEVSATVRINPGAGVTVTFQSAFTISGTLHLLTGNVAGGNLLTLASGALVQRAAGTLDAPPTFGAEIDHQYDASATIGPEFPTASTVARSLNITAGTFTVNRNIQIKGTLTATGNLALAANTLTITGSVPEAHIVDGTVSASGAGGISFSLAAGGAAYTVNVDRSAGGLLALPNVAVSSGTSTNPTVRFANASATSVSITGSLTNSGSGAVTVPNAALATVTVTGDVSNTSNGTITFGDHDVSIGGNVTNSGSLTTPTNNRANIVFPNITAGDDVTITGNVTNSPVLSGTVATDLTRQNMGLIDFQGGVTISGTVTNSAQVDVSTTAPTSGATIFQNSGNIQFANVVLTLTGATRNQSTRTTGTVGTGSTFTNTGSITFAHVATAVSVEGGLTNASSGFTGGTANGRIVFTARAAGTVTVGTAASNQNLTNSSSNTASTNGNIDLTAAATGAVLINGTVVMDGAAGDGDIIFSAGNVTAGGFTLTRNDADAVVTIAADGGVARTHNLGVVSISAADAELSIGALTNAGSAVTVSNLNMSNGTFTPGGGASVAAITFTGPFSATGGTIDLGTGVRNANIQSATANITGVSFANGGGTTLVFNRTTSGQTLTAGANTVFPGNMTISNTFPNAPIFSFPSGNFTVQGTLTFTDNASTTNGVDLGAGRLIITSSDGTGAAEFINNEGYTASTGVVTMQGAGVQQVTGTGNFFSIEINNAAGVNFDDNTGGGVVHTITGTFYLTNGNVGEGTADDIAFNNATTAPTIVRRSGTFASAPTFTTSVSVVYTSTANITSDLELPTATNRLRDLSVFTAGGNRIVTVNVGANPFVNGTLTVNTGQTLALVANTLTMNGASIVNNGTITNTTGGITLNRTAGTTITGAGLLSPITVANASGGNVITGSAGIANAGGAAGTGNLTLNGGGAAGTITLEFSGAGPHINNLTTNGPNNVVTLAANAIVGGNLVHNNGTIALGAFNLTVGSGVTAAAHIVDASGAFTSSGGTLIFSNSAAGNPTLTAGTAAATIAAPLQMNLATAGSNLDLAGFDFTLSNILTLTRGTLDLNAINVNLTGNALNLTANSSVIASGAGVLRFNPASGDLTVTLAGNTNLPATRVSGNTTLAGAAGDLTVASLLHDGGTINFADRDITVQGAFNRTAAGAAYSATSGELIIQGAFNQGTGFTIPNLAINSAGNLTVGNAQNFTVSSQFRLDMTGGAGAETFTHTVGASPRLNISDGALVVFNRGTLDVAPVYAASITLVGGNNATGAIPATVWPASPTALVTTFRADAVGGTGVDVRLPGNRTVGNTLDLRVGRVDLSTGNAAGRTLTVAGSTVRRRQGGSLVLDAGGGTNLGTLTYVNPPDVIYEPSVGGAGGNITSGDELPGTVNSITITRSDNVPNSITTIQSPVTVNGTLTIRNNLTTTAAATITALGNIEIANDTQSNAAAPATVFGAPVAFAGSADQTFNLNGNRTVGSLTINQASSSNRVNISGGNLTISPNSVVNFVRGLLATGSNFVQLDNPFGTAAQGYTRTVAAGEVSHVFGNVRKNLKQGTGPAFGRNEFPVGDPTLYRPVAITIIGANNANLGINTTVGHDNTRPTGIVGLPIANGVSPGVDIARYPSFSWPISSDISIGNTQFDLELTATGFTIPPTDAIANIRIIRRLGGAADVGNDWTLQGTNYDNFVAAGVPTVVNRNSVGGIRPEGGLFTYGLKSNLFIQNVIANQTLTAGGASFTRDLTSPAVVGGAEGALTFSAVSSNTAIATASVVGNTLTVTPIAAGTATITVTGEDASTGARISTTFTVTVSPAFVCGDPSGNGSVAAFDASLVLQHVAGLTVLTGNAALAADVSGNGQIAAFDASLILQFVAGIITSFPSGACPGGGLAKEIISTGTLGWNEASSAGTPELVSLPITISDAQNVTAVQLSAKIDPTVLSVEKINAKLPEDWLIVHNVRNGELIVAMAGVTPITSGEIAEIVFRIHDPEASVTVSATGFVNENTPQDFGDVRIRQIPTEYVLHQNYPNPFNPTTEIKYGLKEDGRVVLEIYNIMGQKVRTLVNGEGQEAGFYTIQWDGRSDAGVSVTSGVYLYRIQAGKFIAMKKMMLVK